MIPVLMVYLYMPLYNCSENSVHIKCIALYAALYAAVLLCRPSGVMACTFTSHADDQGSIPTGDRFGWMQGRPPNHGANGRGFH